MIYNLDLSQAENRIVAYIANDARMISAFTDPNIITHGGVHSLTASYIFEIPIEEVSDAKGSSVFNQNLSQRDIGKRANHAINYRMGTNTFAEAADITIPQARVIREQYLNTVYPMVKRGYWEYIETSIRDKRAVIDLFGKTYKPMDRWGEDLLKQMCAFIPQSTVAHIINELGLMHIWRNRKTTMKIVQLLKQDHDAITIQIRDKHPIAKHRLALNELRNNLLVELTFADRKWTIPVDISAGYNLGKYHKKDNPLGQQALGFNRHKETFNIQLNRIMNDHNTR